MKIFVFLLISAFSLAAGGVAVLAVNDYDVLSLEIWELAIQALIEEPAEMVDAALKGDQRDLFGGVLATIVGTTLALLTMAVMNIVWIVKGLMGGFRSMRRDARWDIGKISKERRREEKDQAADAPKVKSKKPGLLGRMKAWHNRRKETVFRDRDAGLEVDETKKKGPSLFARIKKKIQDAGKKKQPVVIQSSGKDSVVLDAENAGDFEADLREWFGAIKGVGPNDREMILKARDLKKRATGKIRESVIEEDPMNGEFMLRMLEAWAAKSADSGGVEKPEKSSDPIRRTESDSVFARAIEDVEQNGLSDGLSDGDVEMGGDEDEIIDDFTIEDFEVEDDAGAETTSHEGREDEVDDVTDQDDGSGDDLKSIPAARIVMNFEGQIAAVLEGSSEWDEDLTDENSRAEHIEKMIEGLRLVLDQEWDEIQLLSPLDMGDDQEVVDWVKENGADLEAVKRRLLETANSEGSVDDGGVEDDADLNDAFSAFPQVETADQDVAETMEEGTREEGEEKADPSDEVVDEPWDDAAESSEDSAEESGEEDVASAKDATEPRDLSIPDLEEIEQSGELIYKWGLAVRSAGAAEARLCHSVLAKDGVRRRVVGIVHLVAKWRNDQNDEGKRINIVLRYVPEGEWFLDDDAALARLTNLDGDYIEVNPLLREQPEIEESLLLVHFHGPGAPDGLREERNNIVLTSEALSAEEIRGKIS